MRRLIPLNSSPEKAAETNDYEESDVISPTGFGFSLRTRNSNGYNWK